MNKIKTEMEMVKKEKAELQSKLEKAEKTATELNNELQEIKKKDLEKEAKEVIEKAIENGQYNPKLLDLKIEQYMRDKETILKELEILPKIDSERKSSNGDIETGFNLTAEEKEIMLEAGLDPKTSEDVEIFKKEFKRD